MAKSSAIKLDFPFWFPARTQKRTEASLDEFNQRCEIE